MISHLAYSSPIQEEPASPVQLLEYPDESYFSKSSEIDASPNSNSIKVEFHVKTTRAGKPFVLVSFDSILGEGWQDPHGVIWYKMVVDEKQSPIKATYEEARHFCESHSATLASSTSCQYLNSWLPAHDPVDNPHSIFSDPYLDKPFWTLQEKWHREGTAMIYNIGKDTGIAQEQSRKSFIRCVKNTK